MNTIINSHHHNAVHFLSTSFSTEKEDKHNLTSDQKWRKQERKEGERNVCKTHHRLQGSIGMMMKGRKRISQRRKWRKRRWRRQWWWFRCRWWSRRWMRGTTCCWRMRMTMTGRSGWRSWRRSPSFFILVNESLLEFIYFHFFLVIHLLLIFILVVENFDFIFFIVSGRRRWCSRHLSMAVLPKRSSRGLEKKTVASSLFFRFVVVFSPCRLRLTVKQGSSLLLRKRATEKMQRKMQREDAAQGRKTREVRRKRLQESETRCEEEGSGFKSKKLLREQGEKTPPNSTVYSLRVFAVYIHCGRDDRDAVKQSDSLLLMLLWRDILFSRCCCFLLVMTSFLPCFSWSKEVLILTRLLLAVYFFRRRKKITKQIPCVFEEKKKNITCFLFVKDARKSIFFSHSLLSS